MHGLGHDVGRRVAHRVELAVRAGVEELVRRAALGRLEHLVVLGARRRFLSIISASLRITKPLVLRQDERSGLPRFHPPSRPPSSGAPARSWRANGRIPGRFAGRSRVVPSRRPTVGLPAVAAALWGPDRGGVSRSTRCYRMVGDTGLEPVTSCMSSKCSNQLS